MTKRKKYMSYVVTVIVALLVCVILGGIRFIGDIRQSDVKLSDITPLEDIRKSGKNLSDGRIKVIVNSWLNKVVGIGTSDSTWITIGWWRSKGKAPHIELSWIISDYQYSITYKQVNLYFVDGHFKLKSFINTLNIGLPP